MPHVAEYFWIGGQDTCHDLRSKYKTMEGLPLDAPVEMYPEWNFDGSSTGQCLGRDTEILLKPVCVFPHPFMPNATLVLAECYTPQGQPTRCNTRAFAEYVFKKYEDHEPTFGLEQEYFLTEDAWPYKWPKNAFLPPQGPYYCGNGGHALGRDIVLEHYQACLFAGLRVSGVNAEVAPSQWEFQVGPSPGIEEGDHMVTARFLFKKLAEKHGMEVNYEPKPVFARGGDWNGSGCHTNFSTKEMRKEGGFAHIMTAVENLGKHRSEDMTYYGVGNEFRLTGKHETASIEDFSHGVGTRDTSIRIPNMVRKYQKGYFEDRRPAANIDPYMVSVRIFLSSLDLPELASMPPSTVYLERGVKAADWMEKCPDFKPKEVMQARS